MTNKSRHNDECNMFDEYVLCSDCSSYPNGYPKNKCVKLNYGGDCWIAHSTQENNTYNPENFIGNLDTNKPWVVLTLCNYLKWVAFQFGKDACTLLKELTDNGTIADGHKFVGISKSGVCELVTIAKDCLPFGTVFLAKSINFSEDTNFSGQSSDNFHQRLPVNAGGVGLDIYRTFSSELVLSVQDYPCLAESGLEIRVNMSANIGYYVRALWAIVNNELHPDVYENSNPVYVRKPYGYLHVLSPYQWALETEVDGQTVALNADRYALNLSGYNQDSSDSHDFIVTTTGSDIVINSHINISAVYENVSFPTDPLQTPQDLFAIDMAAISATFSPV